MAIKIINNSFFQVCANQWFCQAIDLVSHFVSLLIIFINLKKKLKKYDSSLTWFNNFTQTNYSKLMSKCRNCINTNITSSIKLLLFYFSNHFSQLRAFCQQSFDRGLHDRQQLGLSVRGGRCRQGRHGWRRRPAVLESGFPAGFALQQPKSGCSAFVRTRYLKLHF